MLACMPATDFRELVPHSVEFLLRLKRVLAVLSSAVLLLVIVWRHGGDGVGVRKGKGHASVAVIYGVKICKVCG